MRRAPAVDLGHLEGNLKFLENSRKGLDMFKQQGKTAVDLDNRHNSGRISYNTHWREPLHQDGYIDPKGLLSKHTPISRMTAAEVERLRRDYEGKRYWISTTEENTNYALKLGFRQVEDEAKDYYSLEEAKELYAVCDDPTRIIWKVMATFIGAPKWLYHFHKAGFKTMILWHPTEHNHPLPLDMKDWCDYYRGGQPQFKLTR